MYEKPASRRRCEEEPSTAAHVGPVYHLGEIETVQGTGAAWRIPIVTNGITVSFQVDTGALFSLLSREIYNRLHQPSDSRNLPYGATESLPVDGQCMGQVILDSGHARYLRFLLVLFKEKPLLGLGACRHLGLIYLVSSVQARLDTSTSSEAVLEGAGPFGHKVERIQRPANSEKYLEESYV